MIPLFYDLHIHSCLSPCGDSDMTPANIAGMAAVKGLDVIALTDHNSCRNCAAAMAAGREYGVTVIPGMELTTQEEVHVVCLFPELKAALEFDAMVYARLQRIENKPEIFGEQLLYNEQDTIIGREPYLLINATDITFDEVSDRTAEYGGIMIPAHIDKNANSLIANLGFIPPDSRFTCAELKNMSNLHRLRREHPYLNGCKIITNSDAHYLEQINEPIHTLYAEECSIRSVLDALRTGG